MQLEYNYYEFCKLIGQTVLLTYLDPHMFTQCSGHLEFFPQQSFIACDEGQRQCDTRVTRTQECIL